MKIELTDQQKERQAEYRAFTDAEIFPLANQFDQEERVPLELIKKMAELGYLGTIIPKEHGGSELDMITYGLLNEEIGRGCSSVRSLLTVHGMASYSINRWGKAALKEKWLPQMAAGDVLGAFALTEPDIGSDAKNIQTTAELDGDTYILNGHKKWITYAQIAHLFVLFVQVNKKPLAILVERDTPGLTITPMYGLLGTRASLLAELKFDNCKVPKTNSLAGLGFGFLAVAASALDVGRYSVACGSVGIGQACLEASLQYADERKQFGVPLKKHQLIRQMLANMITNVKAARLLCYQAGYLKDINHPSSTNETLLAKYFASTMANKVASDAVQIHGANGCASEYPVQRYFRDAKVMEIIEGSSQMQQILIARTGYETF